MRVGSPSHPSHLSWENKLQFSCLILCICSDNLFPTSQLSCRPLPASCLAPSCKKQETYAVLSTRQSCCHWILAFTNRRSCFNWLNGCFDAMKSTTDAGFFCNSIADLIGDETNFFCFRSASA